MARYLVAQAPVAAQVRALAALLIALFKAAVLPAAKFTTLRLELELNREPSAAFALTFVLAMAGAAATVAMI